MCRCQLITTSATSIRKVGPHRDKGHPPAKTDLHLSASGARWAGKLSSYACPISLLKKRMARRHAQGLLATGLLLQSLHLLSSLPACT